jgi:hypothetical protein
MSESEPQGIFEQFVRDASSEYQKTDIWIGGNFSTFVLNYAMEKDKTSKEGKTK